MDRLPGRDAPVLIGQHYVTRPPALLLATLGTLALLATCAAPVAAPQPTSPPVCASVSKDDADDDCEDDAAVRYPPGGLPQLRPTPAPAAQPPPGPPRVETVLEQLSMPLGLTWTPDGTRLFFSEVKLGQIRLVVDGALQPEPFASLKIARGAETGMLGLAVDPDYGRNRYVYAYHSDPDQKRNRVLRFRDDNGRAAEPTEILKTVPVSGDGVHNGGRLAFGPDGYLYVSVGDGQRSAGPKDPCKIAGKILRITRDGVSAPDNPFGCSEAYATGFRNPFGLAFHPLSGGLYATDNGGSGNDHLDLVHRAAQYRHPGGTGQPDGPQYVEPLWESDRISIGPTGLAFYTGDRLPEYKHDLFFCGVHTGQLSRVRLAAPAYDRVEAMDVGLLRDQVDCRLDVANGPDGALYYTDFSRILRITR